MILQFRNNSIHRKSHHSDMKKYGQKHRYAFLTALIFWTAGTLFAGTNDLTTLIQRGLFEEEANHNLSAAIQAYQEAIGQIEKDRKLAATAVFRLGECYRKQGKT